MLSFPKELDMIIHQEHRAYVQLLPVLVPSRDALHQTYTLQRQSHDILAKWLPPVSFLSTAHNLNSFEPSWWSSSTKHWHMCLRSEVSDSRSLLLQPSCPPWKDRVVRSLTIYLQQRPWPPRPQWANSLDGVDRDRHVFHAVWKAFPQFYRLMTLTELFDLQSRAKLTGLCSSR